MEEITFQVRDAQSGFLTKVAQPDKVNALTQIALFTKALKTSSDDSIRSYDLTWLIHLVGDVHQPLHATTRFDKQTPNGDAGGNLVHICSAAQMEKDPGKGRTVLHSFWDGLPVQTRGRKVLKPSPGNSTSRMPTLPRTPILPTGSTKASKLPRSTLTLTQSRSEPVHSS
jgi:hypothetical protein